MVYVAFLRGINVGSKAKVEMPKLKQTFEALGCQKVATYINSGNVIFSDARSGKQLEPLVEAAIAKDFGLNIRVVLRDLEAISLLCARIPANWTNNDKQKTDVLFLWGEIDNVNILGKIIVNPKVENVRYIAGALVWNTGRQNAVRGNSVKLVKTDLYQYMTIRNINTVRKIHDLMRQIK